MAVKKHGNSKKVAAKAARTNTPDAEVRRAAYTIREFCKAYPISEAMYFKLRAAGGGPREFRVGRKVMISIEAAADWRRGRENAPQSIA